MLADQIPDAEEQKAFLKKVAELKPKAKPRAEGVKAAPVPAAPPAKVAATAKGFSPDVLLTCERALASYVGPLAKLLIREAATETSDLKELYRKLADHIDSEDERRDFLAKLPR
jgi:serine/threonine-protein kinase